MCTGGLHVPRRCSPTQARVGLTPGAPVWASPASPPPRKPRRRRVPPPPARPFTLSRQIQNQRARLDLGSIRPRPPDPNPAAGNQTYRFALHVLLKSPSLLLISTRSLNLFKNIYTQAQFLTLRPPNFFNFEPAVQPLSFCALYPRFNVYLCLGHQFLQKTPRNSILLTVKPLDLVFALDFTF